LYPYHYAIAEVAKNYPVRELVEVPFRAIGGILFQVFLFQVFLGTSGNKRREST
jgi:hypothetical protein